MVEELNRPHLKLTLAFCIHENCIVQFAKCLPDSYREPTAYFFSLQMRYAWANCYLCGHARANPHSRLRFPIHTANRPPYTRIERILRDSSFQQGSADYFGNQRGDPLRKPLFGAGQECSGSRPGTVPG